MGRIRNPHSQLSVIRALAMAAIRREDWQTALHHYCAWLALDPDSDHAHDGLARITGALLDARATPLPNPAQPASAPDQPANLIHHLRMYGWVRHTVDRALSSDG